MAITQSLSRRQARGLSYLVSLSWLLSLLMIGGMITIRSSHAVDDNANSIDTPQITNLPPAIATRLSQARLPQDSLSVVVTPLPMTALQGQKQPDTTPPILAYLATTPRIPASTQKLIPTWIALETLGKDFVWQTRLYRHGIQVGDTFYGDIILQGGGDPKLAVDDLTALLDTLKTQSFRHIHGNLILDNHLFQQVQYDPNAFDGKGLRPYNAAPNALLVNFGTVTVNLLPKVTDTATTDNHDTDSHLASQPLPQAVILPLKTVDEFLVTTSPKMVNFVAPTRIAADAAPCPPKSEDEVASVTVTELVFTQLPSKACGEQTFWLTYPDANRLIQNTVAAYWQTVGMDLSGQILFVQDAPPPKYWQIWKTHTEPKLIASHDSAPLSQQIHDINHFSNNVMTEQLALSLPVYADNQPLSDYPRTFAYIDRWWRQHLPSYPAPLMTRASGLCRDCRITPQSLAALLNHAYKDANFEIFKSSLGVAGESGTIKSLKARAPHHPAIGRAWIKTGTLDNVISMAGYVQGQSGQWYSVVAIINADNVKANPTAKSVLDEVLAWVAIR